MRILCWIFGHKWYITASSITRPDVYRRLFEAKCERCNKEIIEERWAFCEEAGALHHFMERNIK